MSEVEMHKEGNFALAEKRADIAWSSSGCDINRFSTKMSRAIPSEQTQEAGDGRKQGGTGI